MPSPVPKSRFYPVFGVIYIYIYLTAYQSLFQLLKSETFWIIKIFFFFFHINNFENKDFSDTRSYYLLYSWRGKMNQYLSQEYLHIYECNQLCSAISHSKLLSVKPLAYQSYKGNCLSKCWIAKKQSILSSFVVNWKQYLLKRQASLINSKGVILTG